MTLNLIFRINSLLIPPLGFLLNFILLLLILYRTPKEMWLHSRVLLQTCILDILLLIIFCIGIPYGTFIDEDGTILFTLFDGYLIRSGLFRPFFNDPVCLCFLFLIWFSFFQLDIYAISLQFLYRYLVLNRSMKITLYQYLLFLTLPLICSFSLSCCGYYLIKPLMNISIDLSNISIDFNENITFAYFEFKQPLTKIILLINIIPYLLSYSIIIFCGRQMVKYVAAHAMHERLRELNKQLTKSLIIIASFPLIYEAFLGLFLITSILIAVVNANQGFFVHILINWLPIFNPLASLWTFRPYRDALMAPFKKATIVVPLQLSTTT